jgi:hypothetical protein
MACGLSDQTLSSIQSEWKNLNNCRFASFCPFFLKKDKISQLQNALAIFGPIFYCSILIGLPLSLVSRFAL